MEELEKTHLEQQNNVHAELRKEMALLQKKILIDTVSNVCFRHDLKVVLIIDSC